MPGYFLDTSALVKHYHPEVGSVEVDRLWNDSANSLFTSRLSSLEIVSAFAGKVRTGKIPTADFNTLTRRFSADVAEKHLLTIRLLASHAKEADRLLRQHGTSSPIRTLDALQLAVALDLRGRGFVSHFVCADHDLLSIAAREGLSVFDPENPRDGL
jgi:predicted nucleic acid-binding protein